MHRYPDDQPVARSVLEAQRHCGHQQARVFQNGKVTLARGFFAALSSRVGAVFGVGYAGVVQRGVAHVLRAFPGNQVKNDATGQHQQHRQAEDPPPLQVQYINHHYRGDVRQHRSAAGGEHIEAINLAALGSAPPV